jgi:hypothetical protein
VKEEGWREAYDYRREYLKSNPGFLGRVHFCSSCLKPIRSVKDLQVDHVVSPARFIDLKSLMDRNHKFKRTKKKSALSVALNRKYNLVSICPKCNLAKSDKLGIMTVQGMIAKVVETAMQWTQRGIITTVGVARLGTQTLFINKKKKPKSLKQLTPNISDNILTSVLADLFYICYGTLWLGTFASIKLGSFAVKWTATSIAPKTLKITGATVKRIVKPVTSKKTSTLTKFIYMSVLLVASYFLVYKIFL